MSVPKRMLRIVVNQVKKERPQVFYKENDFAQPNAGSQALVMTLYEKCQRGYFSSILPSGKKIGIPNKSHKSGERSTSIGRSPYEYVNCDV